MCGRYAIVILDSELLAAFGVFERPDFLAGWKPRYNVAPTQSAPVIRAAESASDEPANRIDLLHWGLIPSWAKDPSMGARMINARSESAAEKPAFRSAFKRRRCIVPATGFYEWKKTGSAKQPFFIHRADDEAIAFAGLWESWEDKGRNNGLGLVESFTILTCEPNDDLRELHDRMPVILPRDRHEAWLDPENDDADELQAMLRPLDDGVLDMYPVSRHVNSPKHTDSKCLEPLGDDEPPASLFG